MEIYTFVLLSVLAVATAIGMVFTRSTVNSALFLVLNLISVAGLYLLLQAQFLAFIQVVVYAGAIMVLFLFVIMLLNIGDQEKFTKQINFKLIRSFLAGAVVLAQIIYSRGGVADFLPEISPPITAVGAFEDRGAGEIYKAD